MSETVYVTAQAPKSKGWIAVLVVLAVMVLGFFILAAGSCLALVACSSLLAMDDMTPVAGPEGYVGVLHIEGTITSDSTSSMFGPLGTYDQDYLLRAVKQMGEDASNRGILLLINSPGGEVYATDELYLSLMDYKEATGRPIYAYGANVAASGGYYLACSADKIIMNRNCTTGSIGVTAGTHIDLSAFLEAHGIRLTPLHVGDNKGMGSYFEQMTPEALDIFEAWLMETYDQFVEVVAASRQMDIDEVKAIADGRVFAPKKAMEVGLVDDIMTFEQAKEQMIRDHGFSENVLFYDYDFYQTLGFSPFFEAIMASNQSTTDAVWSKLERPYEGLGYYYPGLQTLV